MQREGGRGRRTHVVHSRNISNNPIDRVLRWQRWIGLRGRKVAGNCIVEFLLVLADCRPIEVQIGVFAVSSCICLCVCCKCPVQIGRAVADAEEQRKVGVSDHIPRVSVVYIERYGFFGMRHALPDILGHALLISWHLPQNH